MSTPFLQDMGVPSSGKPSATGSSKTFSDGPTLRSKTSTTGSDATASSSSASADPSARIIAHMNKDHTDTLSRYLAAFQLLPSFATNSARLAYLSTECMRIETPAPVASPRSYTIKFNPPLGSLSEARQRLIELDKLATETLGREPVTVKRYVGPQGPLAWSWVLFVVSSIALNSMPSNGRWVGDKLGRQDVGDFLVRAQPWVIGTILLLHIVEASYMSKRMVSYTVNVGSGLWWKWVSAVALEGFTAIWRFNEEVRVEKRKLDKANH